MDLGWEGLGKALKRLADVIEYDFHTEIIMGIAKWGVVPAVFLSFSFRVDFSPIKLSLRKNEVVVHDEPVWFVRPMADIKGQRVLLVDDFSVAVYTIEMPKDALLDIGTAAVRTATLAVYLVSIRPDYYAIETNDCIISPWDKQVFNGLTWIMNLEYQEEINKVEQGK